ncbi:sigma-54 interaction domain-containing protein [Hugenholtzia roseola]|uniref:sigma-54 interaction domain-containing protein n=1 Tax=Hugenholtzia roseola TaxID=1002 RepID=UPI000403DB41|nr:sigma-54 dependent transcriptional regulator [Hugenholtzia roseola]
MQDVQELLAIKQKFGIIGNSPLLNQAIRVASQVAPTEMTVLITGESGSGKESFSKIIHHLSPRKHNTFIAINCGAIPEGTVSSELFGHEKGSFTGAAGVRKGYFEEANGGTIFLDEVGELPLETQAMLLRVLENGEFIKVGSSKAEKTNVRVVAATNVRLVEAVEKGKFREDLYYRLNTVPIYVPPLRERGEDVELLFRKFASDFSEKYHIKPLVLEPQAKETLQQYPFPGNVRQLKHIVEQMCVLEGENRYISGDTLAKYLPKNAPSRLPALTQESSKDSFSERELLYKILFDMKRDVTELKQLVLHLLQGKNSAAMIQQYHHLFQEVESKGGNAAAFQGNYAPLTQSPIFLGEKITPSYSSAYANEEEDTIDVGNVNIVEATKQGEKEEAFAYAETQAEGEKEPIETDSFSLEKKEKELIIKALDKHKGKRKQAAQDLGISERTLYRKIKQYELD